MKRWATIGEAQINEFKDNDGIINDHHVCGFQINVNPSVLNVHESILIRYLMSELKCGKPK